MSSGIPFSHRVATSCGYSTLTFIRLLPAVLIPAYISEVREAAKATDEPVLYPIKENKRIKKYWEGIDKKKASLIASAIKEADLQ
ncbi:hypothetical protein [Dubosiella newyorkensis]|uniref:hypothetical protein n=1 Tax=Dubosiella newyorkensis TaxID=1862672 RepID=UPI003F672A1A